MVRRNLIKRRKATPVTIPRAGRADLAGEPIIKAIEDPGSSVLARALNWYNALNCQSRPDLFKGWTVDYMKTREFDREYIEGFKKLPDNWVNSTAAAMSRLILNGTAFPREMLAKHDERIIRTLREARVIGERPPKETDGGVRARVREALDNRIADIEVMLDQFSASGYSDAFSLYEHLVETQCPVMMAKGIADNYRPLLEELREIKSDDQLREGYRHLAKDQLNRLMDQIGSIVEVADRYAANQKATTVRKPRLRKEKSAAQLTKNLRHLKEFRELQIVSTEPATVVGSSAVFVYNVRYKALTLYVAQGPAGLTIKGQSIKNFGPETSSRKVLRKPADSIKAVLASTSRTAPKVMDALKTRASTPNGRINEDTVILRVFR